MKRISSLILLLFSAYGMYAQKGVDMKARYDSAKIEFRNFEKLHGGFVQTNNTNMHYLEWGSAKDTPLIWVHGSFTNGYLELSDRADAIVKKGYHLIAIDYYGHGLTKIPKHEVSLYHVADDIKALMDAKKIRKAVIGGWSRGGVIATAFYDAYPDRVLGLILEDGGSVSTNTHYHKMSETQMNEQIKDAFKDRSFYRIGYKNQFEAYKAYYDNDGGGTQFGILAIIALDDNDGLWRYGPGVENLFNMKNEAEFTDNILRPTKATLFGESMAILEPKIVYRNLTVPMLILDPVSNDDPFPYETENEALRKQHPELIVHKIYPDTGHNLHYEKPDMFVKDLGDFLKTVKAASKKQ